MYEETLEDERGNDSEMTSESEEPEDGDGYFSSADDSVSENTYDEKSESSEDRADEKVAQSDFVKVAIDWVEFEGALENNSPELHSFLNKVTGDVIRVFEGGENADSRLKQTEANPDFIYIEPISSREQYRWMEEFIEIVEDGTLKDKLNIAIDGKGAFRRFKDVLVGYPNERERWFTKRSTKLRAHMMEWLKLKGVEATNTPPWEGEEGGVRRDEQRWQRNDNDSRGWRESSSDLRTMAHDMLDLIPSRELPTALAFLEFLKGRRSYRRSRFG